MKQVLALVGIVLVVAVAGYISQSMTGAPTFQYAPGVVQLRTAQYGDIAEVPRMPARNFGPVVQPENTIKVYNGQSYSDLLRDVRLLPRSVIMGSTLSPNELAQYGITIQNNVVSTPDGLPLALVVSQPDEVGGTIVIEEAIPLY